MPYFLHAINTPPESGTPYTDKALAIAQRHTGQTITYLSNPEERESWTHRERRRLIDRTYTALPWLDDDGHPQRRYRELANSNRGYGDLSPFDNHSDEERDQYFIASRYHFAHVSLRSDAMIAYTPTDEYGIADRQTRIRCGRYLDLVAPWLLPIEKDQLCAMIRSMCGATFKLARTPDEIRAVYRYGQGFSSCMDGRNFSADDDTNPVSVYGDSDLAVAYLGDIESDDESRVTARTVVWPARKIYTRIYGDELLACLLKQDEWIDPGWGDSYPLTGARIRAVKCGIDRYVMPYMDTCNTVRLTDCGKFFELCDDDDRGDFQCRETRGFTRSRTCTCDHCDRTFTPGDDDDTVCNSCAREQWTCSGCGDGFYGDDTRHDTTSYRGYARQYCDTCAQDKGSTCERCGDVFYTCQFSDVEHSTRQRDQVSDYCRDCATEVLAKRTSEDPETPVTIVATDDTATLSLPLDPVTPWAPFSDDDDEWFWRSMSNPTLITRNAVWMHTGTRGFFANAPYDVWQHSEFTREEMTRMTRDYVRCADPRGLPFRCIPIGTAIRVVEIPHHTGTKTADQSIRWNPCGDPGHDLCHCNPETAEQLTHATTTDIPLDKRYEVI